MKTCFLISSIRYQKATFLQSNFIFDFNHNSKKQQMSSSTSFFPKNLSTLVIIIANSTEPGRALSPHDIINVDDDNSTTMTPWWSSEWNNHYPVPLSDPVIEGIMKKFIDVAVNRVNDNNCASSSSGVLIISSARHFRFYDRWCSTLLNHVNYAHCISTGQSRDEDCETVARSIQRALRVIIGDSSSSSSSSSSEEEALGKNTSIQYISCLNADNLSHWNFHGESVEEKIITASDSIVPFLCVPQQEDEDEEEDGEEKTEISLVRRVTATGNQMDTPMRRSMSSGENNNNNNNNMNSESFSFSESREMSNSSTYQQLMHHQSDLIGFSVWSKKYCGNLLQKASEIQPWHYYIPLRRLVLKQQQQKQKQEKQQQEDDDAPHTHHPKFQEIKLRFEKFHRLQQVANVMNNNSQQHENQNNNFNFVIGRSYARVGLMGNPSDQLHGKSLATTISNFWATVTIIRTNSDNNDNSATNNNNNNNIPTVSFVAHPVADATDFASMETLFQQSKTDGYSTGGIRLLQATCKRFFQHIKSIVSEYEKNKNDSNNGNNKEELKYAIAKATLQKMKTTGFEMQYDSNVPRQVGLAGSSCIISAALKALLKFYGLMEKKFELSNDLKVDGASLLLPEEIRPTLVMEVESLELNVNCGLMDRVIQMYQGVVAMDFTDPERTKKENSAVYKKLDSSSSCNSLSLSELLPIDSLYLAVALDPSDSGKIHATVRQRFAQGDPEVIAASKKWSNFVDEAVVALSSCSFDDFRKLVDANFDLRRKLYGDECLGWKNLKMVEIARKHHCATKLPGSGGAVLVITRPNDEECNVAALACDLEKHGFSLVKLSPI